MSRLELLKIALQNIINNIDSGNSNLSEEQYDEFFDVVNKLTNPEYHYSKDEACTYLKICRATLDNHVREGKLEIRSHRGSKEKFFYKRDLDKYKETYGK